MMTYHSPHISVAGIQLKMPEDSTLIIKGNK